MTTIPIFARRRGLHCSPSRTNVAIETHKTKLALFSAIGAGVFIMGLFLQVLLVRYLHFGPIMAFVIQGVISVQASFLANRNWTWHDQDTSFWTTCFRFNVQKIITSIANALVYAVMIRLGVNYIVANIATTAVFTAINYVGCHYWSFTSRTVSVEETSTETISTWWPSVSVVIPCKDNAATIYATVQALLDQDYPVLKEIILVGSTGDSTWTALADISDSRLILLEQSPIPGLRDPAIKRDKGIREACGEVIALVDSDIVMDPGWLSMGIALLSKQGGGVVAGGMRSIHDSFWGRFVDGNSLAAKTPRLDRGYVVTTSNFGRRGTKPPIGANVIFTRDVYQNAPFDTKWTYGYEDYEWAWRVVRGGYLVYVSEQLSGRHHHRSTFRDLVREYVRAGDGCARFVRAHRDAPLAHKRLRQAVSLPAIAVGGLLAFGGAVVTIPGRDLLLAVMVTVIALAGWELRRTPLLEALSYPFIGLTLAGAFTYSLTLTLARTHWIAHEATAPLSVIRIRMSSKSKRYVLAIVAIIAVGTALRLWNLATQPDWQVDEVTYTTIAKNLLYYHRLSLPPEYKQPWKPFLFHPPFYFYLLSRWFALVGAGIYKARLLGVASSMIMFSLLSRFIWKDYGPRTAVVTLLFVVADGWLLYVQRVSYMENLLMILVVSTILAYQKARETGYWRWFIIAGVLAGTTAIFKHTGAYIIVTLGVAWLLTRKAHRRHATMLGVTILVVLLYVWYMIHTDGLQTPFTKPFVFAWGHNNYYVHQSQVQLERTLGLQKAGGGSLTSVSQFVHLLFSPMYIMFIPSFLATMAALYLLARTLIRCFRARNLEPIGEHVVLTVWAATSVVIFSVMALKFSQYFILFLLPLYCYLWTYAVKAVQERDVPFQRWILVLVSACVVLAGLASFEIRVHSSPGNVLREASSYVELHIPHNALVISATPVAYTLPQQWCTQRDPKITQECLNQADYIVTWQTYLQSINPENNPGFGKLLQHSIKIKIIRGFNGEIDIWKVIRQPLIQQHRALRS